MPLIECHAPVRWKQLNRDVRRVFVVGGIAAWGRYYRDIATAVVSRESMLRAEHTVADVASTIVHEAQHARLFRLGLGYETGSRWRVERICFRAERNLCRRIPGADIALANANQWLSAGCEEAFTPRAQVQREIDDLAKNGIPNWVIEGLTRLADRRHGTLPVAPGQGAHPE